MPVSRILVGGPLLREPFYRDNQRFNSSKVYSDHGLDSIKPIFLLGTGANGVNHHLSIIKAISQAELIVKSWHSVVEMNKHSRQ